MYGLRSTASAHNISLAGRELFNCGTANSRQPGEARPTLPVW